MADFFTTTFVAAVDKAVASTGSQNSQQTEDRTSGVVAQSTQTTQSKPSGSNFSMCEIIM